MSIPEPQELDAAAASTPDEGQWSASGGTGAIGPTPRDTGLAPDFTQGPTHPGPLPGGGGDKERPGRRLTLFGVSGVRRLDEASPGETPGGRVPFGYRGGPVGGGTILRLWSALSARVRAELGSRGGRDALVWLGLIALLVLYGWYAAGPRLEVAEVPAEVGSGLDVAIQRVAAEKAALQRQIAEAQGRITALEEGLEAERQKGEAPGRASPEAWVPPPVRSSLVAELRGRETERGILIDLADSDLSFPVGRSRLAERDFPILDRIGSALLQHPRLIAWIEGHTDSAGRDEVNLALSQERAEAVKEALVRRGVSADRIEAVGHGETRPIADNGTRAGRDRNRRIEVYLTEVSK